jgi:outer membrane protein TolC
MIAAVLATPAAARAFPSLAELLSGARRVSIENRAAVVTADEQESEALMALGHNLPAISVRGQYTRNQFQVDFSIPDTIKMMLGLTAFPSGPIQPLNQLDAFFQLDVPIVDVAAWARTYVARQQAHAARLNVQVTALNVQKEVARNYYQLVGAEALRQSAARSLEAAQANHSLTVERRAGGVATQLDVARAAAEVERGRQNVADADLLGAISRRALATITGIIANGEAPAAADDLLPEAPLDQWEQTPDNRIPALEVAAEQVRAAGAAARSAKASLLPSLSLTGVEHLTNATGFLLGHNSAYTFVFTLAWRLDLSTIASIRATGQGAELARLRAEQARLAVRDQIYNDWQRVQAGIAKSRAARAQSEAAALAAQFANERYGSGAGTQLDVIQAQRDAFGAEVARIQADADLRFARALLHLDAGIPLDKDQAP